MLAPESRPSAVTESFSISDSVGLVDRARVEVLIPDVIDRYFDAVATELAMFAPQWREWVVKDAVRGFSGFADESDRDLSVNDLCRFSVPYFFREAALQPIPVGQLIADALAGIQRNDPRGPETLCQRDSASIIDVDSPSDLRAQGELLDALISSLGSRAEVHPRPLRAVVFSTTLEYLGPDSLEPDSIGFDIVFDGGKKTALLLPPHREHFVDNIVTVAQELVDIHRQFPDLAVRAVSFDHHGACDPNPSFGTFLSADTDEGRVIVQGASGEAIPGVIRLNADFARVDSHALREAAIATARENGWVARVAGDGITQTLWHEVGHLIAFELSDEDRVSVASALASVAGLEMEGVSSAFEVDRLLATAEARQRIRAAYGEYAALKGTSELLPEAFSMAYPLCADLPQARHARWLFDRVPPRSH